MADRPKTIIQRIQSSKGKLVFYEDNIVEGRVPIEMMQSNAIKQSTSSLDHLPNGEKFTFMDSNLPIRFDPDDHRVSVAPDFYRSRNVDVSAIRDQTAYNLWEVGKPPEFVLEVASPSTYRRDLYEKPDTYASIGVSELWMFDPTGGGLYGQALMGFRLVEGEYEPIEMAPSEHGLMSAYSEELGLRLCAMDMSQRERLLSAQPNLSYVFAENFQPFQLLFQDVNTGQYLLNVKALRAEYERAEARRRVAEAERRLAEAEREAARSRAELAEAERQKAEAERDVERSRAELAEAERDVERSRAELAEAGRRQAEEALEERNARIRELEDQLRRQQG